MSGLPELDEILHGLLPGDNVVWRVDTIEDYSPFAEAFIDKAIRKGEKCMYFRFGNHKPIVTNKSGVAVYEVHPELGFENFITEIHKEIKKIGKGGFYIFDSLSDLSDTCYSDRMIGNFFKLTCPYLRKLETIAYFAMYRYFHSYHAAAPITETTQVLIDVYRYKGSIYIQPFKVEGRYSSTMYMLHEWKNNTFTPTRESAKISEVIASSPWPGLPSASYRMIGVWDKLFMNAETVMQAFGKKQCSEEKRDAVFHQIVKLIMTRDKRVFSLIIENLSLADVIHVWKRMIGTGMIGGKSIGMLVARGILKKHNPDKWMRLLEEHDSFFIGSDVFYTYLVENNCWWARQRQKDPEAFLDGNEDVRRRILQGNFPEYIVSRFSDMLDYFGQSPIIVRSSSLLEDNFGNAFAGKYESVFCTNQGTKEERLTSLLNAVRIIYASTMSDTALSYRKSRGVLDKDEQMALLIQRVSGYCYGNYFFPQLAGVGFSLNPYAWNKEIIPEAGMIRLVFGLGTRAVDRSDDDYTRVVALNAPEKRPEANFDEVKRYAQRRVDVLDLVSDEFSNVHFADLLKQVEGIPVRLFSTRDRALEQYAKEQGNSWVLTFENLFKETSFVQDMRELLRIVREAYETHVDIEFTANFLSEGGYKINLLQCRPLQVQRPHTTTITPIPQIAPENVIMKAHGAVIGHSRVMPIDRLIYVVPAQYGRLPEQKRYSLARFINKLTHYEGGHSAKNIMLLGPGRWGTSTPSLGIPVSFAEINTASVLCEIDAMHEGLVPDLSLGTHFFNEMVEMNMLYIAYFVGKAGNVLNENFLMESSNCLLSIAPDAQEWVDTIKVLDTAKCDSGRKIFLNANSVEQIAAVYRE